MIAINAGLPEYLLNADATAVPFTGEAKALPVLATYGTWTTNYSVAPGAINIVLEASFDGTTWFVIDTSTNVNGEMRNFQTSATQIRARVVSETGGGDITVSVTMKKAFTGAVTATSLAITGNASADKFIGGNGTVGAPTFSFTSEPTLGFYRGAAGSVSLSGSLNVAGQINPSLGLTQAGWMTLGGSSGGGLGMGSGHVVGWNSATSHALFTQVGLDVGLSRTAPGVVSVGTGAAGSAAGTIRAATHLAGDGSAGAPVYSFTSGPTTGLYYNGALNFSTGGIRRAYIDSGGLWVDPAIRPGDGTAGAPVYSFLSEPTLGFWRSSAGNITTQGGLNVTSSLFVSAAQGIRDAVSGARMRWANTGNVIFENTGGTIGSQLKVDALPTIASGFGTGAAVIAGSTPFAGAVTVGTGGASSAGAINFGGTAFPSAPFIVVSHGVGTQQLRVSSSTTGFNINASGAFWTDNDTIYWIAVGAK